MLGDAMLTPLNLARDQCLQKQLFAQLREMIMSGRMAAGSRMPSTRMLAEQFDISRNTVLLSYDRLIAEGYLETRPAHGTFVALTPPGTARHSEHPAGVQPGENGEASGLRKVGYPDPGLFPAGRWRVLMRAALSRIGQCAVVPHPAGDMSLRCAIATWLSTSRGLVVSAEQVLLTNGRQQALHLAAHFALRPGARAVVEDPCESITEATFADAQAELVRVPVDADGIRTDKLPKGAVALVHVTPEHQRPLGITLSTERRAALLAWAGQAGALVLEDDCQGELHYGEKHMPSLMHLDEAERVMLLGSVAAALGPWVTLAYLVVPRHLVGAAVGACRVIGGAPNRLEQIALAELFSGGFYARHLHGVAKVYAARRNALVDALRRHFATPGEFWGLHAGLHLAWFPAPDTGTPTMLATLARHCGLEALALPDLERPALLLGFGAVSEQQIGQRVAKFASLVPRRLGMELAAD
jgi:GntR family transcriptional regulator/MocR family aminotransferase